MSTYRALDPSASWSAWATDFILYATQHENFLKKDFRETYAAMNFEHILETEQQEWSEFYRIYMNNPRVEIYCGNKHPFVEAVLNALLETINLARQAKLDSQISEQVNQEIEAERQRKAQLKAEEEASHTETMIEFYERHARHVQHVLDKEFLAAAQSILGAALQESRLDELKMRMRDLFPEHAIEAAFRKKESTNGQPIAKPKPEPKEPEPKEPEVL